MAGDTRFGAPGDAERGGWSHRPRTAARNRALPSVTRALRPASPKILCIGTDGSSAEDLATTLRRQGFEVRTSWATSGQALQSALRWQPSIVLLETRDEPQANGELFKATSGAPPVIVLASAPASESRAAYIRAGAAVVLNRQRPIKDVIQAIRRQLESDSAPARTSKPRPLPSSRADSLDPKSNPFARLTPREQEVLSSLIDGIPASIIAIESSVSVSTVRTQIRSIFQKLGVNSQLRAVSLARRAGWPEHRPQPD